MHEVLGTVVGRWYVTAFAIVYAAVIVRHLGWRRAAVFTSVAFAVAVAAENASVHVGIPYTRYAFDPALRGQELHIGSAPLFVPLSYTFVTYFAFAAGRLIASGPWRTRATRPWHEWTIAWLLGVWVIWILDPASRLNGLYIGRIFDYQGPGFWFGLPVGSQVGFGAVTALLLAILFWMTRDEPNRPVPGGLLHHPHRIAFVVWHVEAFHLAVAAIVIGQATLGGGFFLIYLPAAFMTAVLWSHLRPAREPEAAPFAVERRLPEPVDA
jgi:uncharacterized membrane protein